VTTVLVVGATGELGQRVCRLLRRWTPNVRVVGANRSGRGHPDFPVHRVDVADERSLAPALRDVTLVVNAAGPYLYDPAPLVRACVAARAHLVDLADDRAWFGAMAEAASRAGAAAAGVAVIPGCSTVPGLVALLAQRWAGRADVASLSAWLSLGSANPPSRGLVAALLAPLGRPAPGGGRWFTQLVTTTSSDGRRLRFGSWPAPVPKAGLRLGARRVPLRFYVGFDRRYLTLALRLAAPLLAGVPSRNVPRLAAMALPLARVLRPLGTQRGALLLHAHDSEGAERDRVEVHALANGLDIPAAPVIWVVQSLLAGGLSAGGLLGLEDVVTPAAATTWLREAGYELREGGGGRS
jgi:NAD(P)-dependent dehydrogenase (short-subunit alcohol dehydrogenase family)